MPRITIEEKLPIDDDLSEIKETTYDLPEKILVDGELMSYDSYHKSYVGHQDSSITAIDYIKMKLNKKKTNENIEEPQK